MCTGTKSFSCLAGVCIYVGVDEAAGGEGLMSEQHRPPPHTASAGCASDEPLSDPSQNITQERF